MPRSLRETDYLMFERLTVTRELLARHRIERVTRLEAAEDKIYIQSDEGIRFPFHLPPINGRSEPQVARYVVREEEKVKPKYVAATGEKPHPFIPVLRPEHRDRYTDKRIPVVIVEAPKSAMAFLRFCEDNGRRLLPIATGGCWNWRGRTGKVVNAEGERVDEKGMLDLIVQLCAGRIVYLLPDANETTKGDVSKARDALATYLLEEKISTDVRIVHLPAPPPKPKMGWNGPDDFLGVEGDQALSDLFERVEKFVQRGGQASVGNRLRTYTPRELKALVPTVMDPIAHPLAVKGMFAVLDGQAKAAGKTTLLLAGVAAMANERAFLGRATKRTNVLYVTEEYQKTFLLGLERCGLAGLDRYMNIMPRDAWQGTSWPELSKELEQLCNKREIGWLVVDTFFAVVGLSRPDDQNDPGLVDAAAAPLRSMAGMMDIATTTSRHERKGGGTIGESGRGSTALTGAADIVLRLQRTGHNPNLRELEVTGRIDSERIVVELVDGSYVVRGNGSHDSGDESERLMKAIEMNPKATYRKLEESTGVNHNRICKLAERLGWEKDKNDGVWVRTTKKAS